jgi:quercetin dioxygenase-like cupin family protein
MPHHRLADIEFKPDDTAPALMKTFTGEFMKAALVHYEEGVAPPPHFHPNEEQFIYLLEGKLRMVLGDETTTIEPGDVVHIPRNVMHGILPVAGRCLFWSVKSPIGDGRHSQDYNRAEDADRLRETMAAMKD